MARRTGVRKSEAGQLTISKERVSKHGEVFTPSWVVNEMIDMVLRESGKSIYGTWFEPAFGRGAFLTEILRRKLEAGMSEEDACKTIYGVELLKDNYEFTIALLVSMCNGKDVEPILRTNLLCGDTLRDMRSLVFKDWKTGQTGSLYDMGWHGMEEAKKELKRKKRK